MNRRRWTVLAVLAALLAGTQHFGLERSAEMRAEAPLRQFKGLPASDILPTYVASLFFGAFRAIAVDVLWIQLKRVEEERRWYERREILKLISYFQPNNPEVWATLGWHSAYNVANGFTDPARAWEWTEFGLTWLRRGIRTIPHDPYLKYQLASTLMHKPTWRDGALDEPLLKRIEESGVLQADLPPDELPRDRRRSAFELAIPWLERSRDELFAAKGSLMKTQMGLFLYPSTMDGFIRQCLIYEGKRLLLQGRAAEARDSFRRAHLHVKDMLGKTYTEVQSPIFKDYLEMYATYPALVDLYEAARGGGEAGELAFLKALQALNAEYGRLDEGVWWHVSDPGAPLNALKQKRSRGLDAQEYNDTPVAATPLRPGDLALANFEPAGMDVDCYAIHLAAPAPDLQVPPRPIPVTLRFSRPEGSQAVFQAAIIDYSGKVLKPLVPDARGEARFEADRYGAWYLRLEPTGAAADSRYRFQYAVGE